MRDDFTKHLEIAPAPPRASVALFVGATILGAFAIPAVYLRTAPLPADTGAPEYSGDALLELSSMNVIEQRIYPISWKRLGFEGSERGTERTLIAPSLGCPWPCFCA